MIRQLVAVLAGALTAAGAAAAGLDSIADPAVKACIARAMPEQSLKHSVTLRALDDAGVRSQSAGEIFWRRNVQGSQRATIRVSEPASRNGMMVLVIEREAKDPQFFLYLPDLGRARKITGKQISTDMMDTDFSYEEFSHLQTMSRSSETVRVEDQAIDGRPVYVLQTTPQDGASMYKEILTFVDQERCIPLRSQFIAPGGEVRKELVAVPEEIRQVGERFVPHQVIMYDRAKASRTELTINNVEIDVELSDALFNPKSFGKSQ
jgi:outer membrane lipoprotein-sorting protein